MPVTKGAIITDCADPNARVRQELRFTSLFGFQPSLLPLGHDCPDLEAAGNLIDQLSAISDLPSSAEVRGAIILVNVAPRGKHANSRWENGSPFGYFHYGQTLVLSSTEGRCLSLAYSLNLVREVEVLDMPRILAAAVERGELDAARAH